MLQGEADTDNVAVFSQFLAGSEEAATAADKGCCGVDTVVFELMSPASMSRRIEYDAMLKVNGRIQAGAEVAGSALEVRRDQQPFAAISFDIDAKSPTAMYLMNSIWRATGVVGHFG